MSETYFKITIYLKSSLPITLYLNTERTKKIMRDYRHTLNTYLQNNYTLRISDCDEEYVIDSREITYIKCEE